MANCWYLCMFSAVFLESVFSFVVFSVPSCWSWTVQHVLKAATLSVIVFRLVIVAHVANCVKQQAPVVFSNNTNRSSVMRLVFVGEKLLFNFYLLTCALLRCIKARSCFW